MNVRMRWLMRGRRVELLGDQNSITFINHSTVLIRLNGVTILTDPVFTRTVAMIVPRLKLPGIPLSELPPIDIILLSHNHYDHLNMKSLRRLRRRGQSIVVVPRGVVKWPRRAGLENIIELNWWDKLPLERHGFTITCVPARHFSGRGLFDHNKTLFCGYVIESDGTTVYFAGDTSYFSVFGEIARKFSIDVALLPIGAYRPDFFRRMHMSPEDALSAFVDLNARAMVPIHWGTFRISEEPIHEPPLRLTTAADRMGIVDKIHILRNGKSFLMETKVLAADVKY